MRLSRVIKIILTYLLTYRLVESDSATDNYFTDADDSDSDSFHSSSSDIDEHETDWKKKQMNNVGIDFDAVTVVPTKPFLPPDGPLEFFCRFFDDDLFDLLVKQTNLYARQNKIRHWEDATIVELKAFLGILIAMGLHHVPTVDLFWSSDPKFRMDRLGLGVF